MALASQQPMENAQDIQQALDLAVRHHTAGRLREAESIYQRILQTDPSQPVALHLLGVVSHQAGNNDIAVDLITRALAVKPDYAEAHNNLGTALIELGRPEEAVASYRRALAIKPNYAMAHNNLAAAHTTLGRPEEAVASHQKALALKPDFSDAHYNLGNAFKELGKLEDTVASCERALGLKPDFAEAHNNRGAALTELGRPEEAVASHQKALALKPDFADAHYNLGKALQDLGRLDEAAASYLKALAIKPDFGEAHNNLGQTFQNQGKLEDAVASYLKALALKPDFAEAHNNLGTALTEQGRPEDAAASFHKALAIRPDFAEAHRHMSVATNHSEHDEDIRAMERAYTKLAISNEQSMHLAFGLGKAFEDLHQYEKAFGYFAEANRIKRESYNYSVDDDVNFVKKLEQVFDASLFRRHKGMGCDDETPMFILGMPRSGTTLVEQILASHRQVHGAGELDNLERIVSSYFNDENGAEFPESIRQVDGADLERSGVEYVRSVRKHSLNTRFITDKTPGNFKYLGLIKMMLPNAKVIHCRRDPADTCLSVFKNYFTGKHEYSYDLGELGRYYNSYRGLMEHWYSVMPGFIHDVQYEDMVADQAGQTRALLDYCDLEWDDACLEFHKTNRPVRTASAGQVRRPVYKDSVRLWKRYEAQLAPLLESLR